MQNNQLNTSIFLKLIMLLMLFSLGNINKLSAQTDSLSYTQETQQDSTFAYLSPMEYAFMLHEKTNWLLKANLLVQTENRETVRFKLSFEKRIAKTISLDAAISYNSSGPNADIYVHGSEFSLEARWYYKTGKNKQSNTTNLSGAYFALGASYNKTKSSTDSQGIRSDYSSIPVFAKWGLQRRFLKRGYVDFGIRSGANISLTEWAPTSFFLGNYVDAGLAFTRDKQELDFDKLCPVLRCHAADRFLLKTNLVDIINVGYLRKTLMGTFRPNIAAEVKLGESLFSINTKLSCGLSYSKTWNYDFHTFTIAPRVLVEGRWYYNLNRRILNGKSGNGLSANYVSFGGLYYGEYQTTIGGSYNYDFNKELFGGRLSTGIQRTIGKHLYFDVNIGVGFGREHEYDGANDKTTNQNVINFDVGIAIGYRF
jgi:hypothetical protein